VLGEALVRAAQDSPTSRQHGPLGYLSPAQFENMTMTKINKENGQTRSPECPQNRVRSSNARLGVCFQTRKQRRAGLTRAGRERDVARATSASRRSN
jgi:hypothetical protein